MGPAEYLALVVGLAAASQWLAWSLRVPSILFLLVIGFLLGRWVTPDDVFGRDLVFAGVTLAVGVILFEGSLSLRLRDLREVGQPVRRLCSWTVLVAWGLITGSAVAVGLDWRLALLVGALLVVTGPTVINPILRQLRPARRVASMLRWEGIVVDPIGAILAVLVYQAVLLSPGDGPIRTAATALAMTLLVSVGLTALLGPALVAVMRRNLIPDFLHAVVFLGVALAALIASNAAQPESGLLTVTLLGIYLGNRPGLDLHAVQEFKEHLQVLFVGTLFVVLAGRIGVEQLSQLGWRAAAFIALLVLVVRPVSVLLGLLGTSATRQERILLAGMAPRGIVAAAVISIFALELEHAAEDARTEDPGAAVELARLAEGAAELVPLVFLTIVVTVAVYGLGVGRLSERLGLATASPSGVMFAGAQGWVREVAATLDALDVPVLLVSRDARDVGRARMAGLRTEHTDVLSEYAVEELDLAGIGLFVAATPDDTVNATAAREFARSLGRANVYQLHHTAAPDPERQGTRRATASHLTAREPFNPPQSYDDLQRRIGDGMTVRRTRLTDRFTLSDFRESHPDAVVMFMVDEGRAEVVTADVTVPGTGTTLVFLTAPRPGSREKDERRAERVAAKKAAKKAGKQSEQQSEQPDGDASGDGS